MGYLEHGSVDAVLLFAGATKTAQITMQAVVMDDAEDLNNADAFFVVGVPNFGIRNAVGR